LSQILVQFIPQLFNYMFLCLHIVWANNKRSWNLFLYSNIDISPYLNAKNSYSFTLQWYLE
jgi:hypothetical protein